ncbi:MAG: 16S rRNA (guanine(966)-N(2))-methyltransferase RsmD [Nitrospira sp.]|nr:16S rRNA (guanine(966)-N(2))-methyltransferase RsmD [Nitrospira sp.]MDR4463676.1 16S rRNA (guanine(966)-N(2))-methyltransferase RsmD [Nitrospira sp.]MDR4468809.1 16S rRNA (guanine(966)-N(2))-methyltransferase RsmD [Nitrospira sp.]
MRVIAGTNRGRRLYTPREHHLRPTSDRVREALFSILGNRLTKSRMLDLYAGTGAVGIEALSRGAAHVTAVESDKEALKLLRLNMQVCRIGDELSLRVQTVHQFLSDPDQWHGPYDLVFADPPYSDAEECASLISKPQSVELLHADSWLVIEHAARTTLPLSVGRTQFLRRYRYGDTALSLYTSLTAECP